MAPDINILVAAFRVDHVHHQIARRWMNQSLVDLAQGGSLVLLPMVATGFLRLVTNRKVFSDPAPIESAVAFVDALLKIPGVEMPHIGGEWPELSRLCLSGKLSANAIPDAWIAAAVKRLHEHLVTFDRDFGVLLEKSELTVLKTN